MCVCLYAWPSVCVTVSVLSPGMFNMDTPWLYMYTTHKLSQPERHTYQLTSELTARKWLTVRNLALEGYYRDRSKDREARLHLYAPAVTYLKV